jgi:hypothetical protein
MKAVAIKLNPMLSSSRAGTSSALLGNKRDVIAYPGKKRTSADDTATLTIDELSAIRIRTKIAIPVTAI